MPEEPRAPDARPLEDLPTPDAADANVRGGAGGLSELDAQQMHLQMQMDRMSKTTSTLSNVTRKISDTSSTIIGNMK